MLENKPFVRQYEKLKFDTFTVKLNADERTQFEKWKYELKQEKDSTAIKQLAEIGAEVLLGQNPTRKALEIVLNNYRKNKRLGIVTYD